MGPNILNQKIFFPDVIVISFFFFFFFFFSSRMKLAASEARSAGFSVRKQY